MSAPRDPRKPGPGRPSTPKGGRSSLSTAAAARSAPLKKKKPPIALLGGVAAGAILLVVLLAVAFSSKPAPVAAVEPPKPPAKPEPAPKPEPKPEPVPVPRPELPKPKPATKPPPGDDKAALKKRQEEKRTSALTRLAEVKAEIAKEKAEAKTAADLLRARLAVRPLELSIRGGETLKGALILSVDPHDGEIQAAGTTRRILWDALEPASLRAAADAIFDAKKGKDQYDRGRFFIARRMWKEAKDAFDAAGRIGDGYESEVLTFINTLERLLSENGAFQGSVRRLGATDIRLAYDWSDKAQLEEFSGGLVLDGKAAVLEAKQKILVFARGAVQDERSIVFQDELSAELRLTTDAPLLFHLFASPNRVHVLELGPQGAVLRREGKAGRQELAKSDKVRLALGKPQEIRIVCRDRAFKVFIEKQEALTAADPPASAEAGVFGGVFAFGLLEKGKLRIEAPFVLQGSMNPADLNKRTSDVETLLRNALNPELEEIRKRREERLADAALGRESAPALSAEHPAFGVPDVSKLSALKNAYFHHDFGPGGAYTPESWAKDVDAMLAKGDGVPALLYLRARFRFERQDYAGALADLGKAVELFPEFHEAHALRAEYLRNRHDLDGALQAANRAIELMPDDAEAYVARGMTAFARNPKSPAAFFEDLELAKQLDPTDPAAANWIRILKYQTRGPRDLGCRFDHETEHYVVTTDISPEAAKRYGEDLEAAFRHYQAVIGKAFPRGFGRKPRVAVFNTAENYYTYFELLSESRGEHTLGVFRAALNELVLFETLDLEATGHTLYHEATHHFMQQLTPTHLPFWINEGIADYLGAIRVKDGKVVQKAMILDRLPAARLAVEVDAVLPFERIMNESPREFYSGNVGLKYAQAWTMVHFFYEAEGGKHRPRLQKYLDLLLAGTPPRPAYEQAFADGVAELEKSWKAFVKALKK